MAQALSVKTVEATKPADRRQEIPDGRARGLFLIVQPSGLKGWAFRYRAPLTGKTRKMTIGPYPAFGLADARTIAEEATRSVQRGIDPADARVEAKARAADTTDLVGTLLDEFIARHIEAKTKASTAAETKRLIEKFVRPTWGKRKAQSVTRRDVVALLDQVADGGAPVTANRLLALVRRFFNWLVERSVLDIAPTVGVKPPTEEFSRERVLSDLELRWLWLATEERTPFNAAVRLLALTGQRRGEAAGLVDQELNLNDTRPTWTIPAKRTKNGRETVVPLSDAAVTAITSVHRIEGAKLLFTSNGRTQISGWSKHKAALDARMLVVARQEAVERGQSPDDVSIAQWQLHDLRRTCASGMARLGHPVHVVEAVLNHKSGSISGVAAVYNRHEYANEKQRALAAWAACLSDLVGPRRHNVVRLAR